MLALLIVAIAAQAPIYGPCDVKNYKLSSFRNQSFPIVPALTASTVTISGLFYIIDGCNFGFRNLTYLGGDITYIYGGFKGSVDSMTLSDTYVLSYAQPTTEVFPLRQVPGSQANFDGFNQVRIYENTLKTIVGTVDLPVPGSSTTPGGSASNPSAKSTGSYLSSSVIITNVDQRSQRFIPLTDAGDTISAVTVSQDRHVFAVVQKSTTEQAISVYDLHTFRKRRKLSVPKHHEDIISLGFSMDRKFLIAQTSGPNWTLLYYAWEKGKTLATISSSLNPQDEVYQISINPFDGYKILASGQNIATVFRYSDLVLLRQEIELPEEAYVQHCWIAVDKFVLGSKEGNLYLVEGGKVLEISSFGDSILAIEATKYGFAVGGCGGSIALYNLTSKIRLIQKYDLPDPTLQVISLSSTTTDDTLLARLNTNLVLKVTVSAPDLFSSHSRAEEMSKFEVFMDSYHTGPITGLDLCVRKPLLITSSSDKSVRIWNYMKGTCELLKFFNDEPLSVSLHPSGLYILVGFSDKLRLLNVLMDDVRLVREFAIRACKKCAFANGGHIFVAVNGNVIQLFSTWTFDNFDNLKGHNGKVRSLYFTPNDSCLVSSGSDGAVYTWNINRMKRENEHILKSCSYFDGLCTPNGKIMYAVGSDCMIKEISESSVVKEFEANHVMTQIALSHTGRMLFAGTQVGCIRALRFPFGDQYEFQEHQAHSKMISRLKISYDDQYLFSSGDDGCLFVFKLTDREEKKSIQDKGIAFANEILITRSDLEEKNILMTEVRRQLEELKLEHEYQLRLKDMNFNEKLKEVQDVYGNDIHELKGSTAELRLEKDKDDVTHQDIIQKLKCNFIEELQTIEIKDNQLLMNEYEKYQQQQNTSSLLNVKCEKEVKEFQNSTDKSLIEVTGRSESKLTIKATDINRLKVEKREQECEFFEMSKQNQEDIDTEILSSQTKYEVKLGLEREEGARLKGENGIMRKKFNTLNKDIDDNKGEIHRMSENGKKLEGIIGVLEKDIVVLRKEMADRDDHIQDKEKKVYELKKRNQELEKYKFVLDFRIKELKEQVEPREKHISFMSKKVKKIDESLKALSVDKVYFESQILKYNEALTVSRDTASKEHRRVKKVDRFIKDFKTELEDVIQYFQDGDVLKRRVENLYAKYCKPITTDLPKVPLFIAKQEILFQKEHLKEIIRDLRSTSEKNSEEYRKSSSRLVTQNQKLIREVTAMRDVPNLTPFLPSLT